VKISFHMGHSRVGTSIQALVSDLNLGTIASTLQSQHRTSSEL
jgi:hypothetical protein